MSALHEYNHTTAGGGFEHSNVLGAFCIIDKPDEIGNQIRQEMTAVTGNNWGQRSSYSPMNINGNFYLPFSPSTTFGLKFAKQYEGTWQSYITNPPPSTEVIKIPFNFYEF